MSAATLTSKGQITIPSKVRSALGLATGDRVEFVEVAEGQFSIIPATKSVKSLKGIVSKPAKPVSLEDMQRAIAKRGAKAR